MIEFFAGFIVGVAVGVLAWQTSPANMNAQIPQPSGEEQGDGEEQGPGEDHCDAAEPYEDPGKVERAARLEQYRRLLRDEFGVDHAGAGE